MQIRFTRAAVGLLLVAAATFTTTACTTDTTAPLQTATTGSPAVGHDAQSLAAQYEWMGKYHNDALAFALTRIKASRKLSKYDRCKVGLAALADFQKAYRKSGGPPIFDDVSITKGMCEAADANGFTGSAVAALAGPEPANIISTTASTYMNQILTQVDLASSVPALAFTVNQIDNQAFATVDGLEAGAVAGTGSIAVSSADYWTTSGSGWTDTQLAYTRSNLSDMTPVPQSPVFITPTTRRIIKADVSAAIAVLLYDWWMGEAAIGKAAVKAAAASLIAGLSVY